MSAFQSGFQTGFQGISSGATLTVTPSGGLSFSGTSGMLRGVIQSALATLTFSGTSSLSFTVAVQSRIISAIGGISFSGAVTQSRTVLRTVSGGLLFGGSATTTLTPDPNPVTSRGFKRGRRPRTRKNY